MTKSAKQDTTKAPADFEESGAAAAADSEAKPEEAAAEATPETADGADKPDLDETKRKFRAALERKHQAHNDAQDKSGQDGGKINGAHGPAASRRSFRRKSG